MPKLVDLKGQRFGSLTVLSKLSSTRGGSVLWDCRCDCGSSYQASTRHLNRKRHTVRSCGCQQHPVAVRNKLWKGFGDISGQWWNSHVKHSANSKGRAAVGLTIDPEYAYNLFLLQDRRCALSGETLVIHNASSKNTASLDRIDNTLGYEPGNVRWVHKVINMMKRIYSDAYFIAWCQRVAEHS